MSKKQHTLWVNKYQVTDADQYICSDELRTDLKRWIKENDIPHLLFHGPAGTGKTTLAELIVSNLKCDYIIINSSDENGIDTIREKIKSFASSASFRPLKVIILDEADALTKEAQSALRFVIEEYALNTRFILTCNYVQRIIEPIVSRCDDYELSKLSKPEIARFVANNILDKESIAYDIADVAKIINAFYPDVRSIVKKLQRYSKNGVLQFKEENLLDEYTFKILAILKAPNKDSWKEIRQILADAQVDDYQPLYRFLFDHAKDFAKDKEPDIVITLDEYMWRSGVVPDREINIAACIAQLLTIIKK